MTCNFTMHSAQCGGPTRLFAACATALGRALVDRELYLPKARTEDRERCRAAKVPDERVFATKDELARHMMLRSLASPLPVAWGTASVSKRQPLHRMIIA